MLRTLLIITILLAACTFSNAENNASPPSATAGSGQRAFPEFSWDRLPVCIHLARNDDDFTKKDLEFMSRFPLICIEKNQALRKYGNMEEGTYAAAKAIKKLNPRSKVLFYMNSRIDYGDLYSFGRILDDDAHPEWAMRNLQGELVTVHSTNRRTYDPSVKEMRDWWLTIPLKAMEKAPLDGVFVDALPQYASSPEGKKRQWGAEHYDRIMEGLYDMLTRLKNGLGPDRIMIANFLRGEPRAMSDMGTRFFDYTDGGMLEHFAAISGNERDIIERDIELLRDAGKRGKIIVFKGWPRYNFTDAAAYKGKSQAEMDSIARRDITFPLACFLIGAGEYAYFCYSWGYQYADGGLVDYEEFDKPLGAPFGECVREGWEYSREFTHASVWVNIDTREARIDWKRE